MNFKKSQTLEGIATILNCEFVGHVDFPVFGCNEIHVVRPGDIVFVELPDVGTAVTAGGDMATVESFKAASSVYAPLSGEIIEINDSLSDDPAQVNSEPLGAGWFVKIKLDNPSAADALMDEDAYKALIA